MTPYEVLQVMPNASAEFIRAAWAFQVKQVHPDGPKPNPKKTRELNEAYAVLKDPVKREALDKELVASRAQPRSRKKAPEHRAAPEPYVQAYPDAYEGFFPERIDDMIDHLTQAANAPPIVGDFFKFAQRQAWRKP